MKRHSRWKRLIPVLTLFFVLGAAFNVLAAGVKGGVTAVYSDRITGWAWNEGVYDETVKVELRIYKDGATEPAKTAEVSANTFSADLSKSIGDGFHAFDYAFDFAKLGGTSYRVEAYAVVGEEKLLLAEATKVKASDLTAAPVKKSAADIQAEKDATTGPGATKTTTKAETDSTGKYKKGNSLGTFTTSGYCTCTKCSGSGNGKTYSGTIPKAKHTISADLSVLPLGTKVMIGDVVYTVEDMGSGVDGKWIDIYYDSHEEAVAHGLKKQEVFAVVEE